MGDQPRDGDTKKCPECGHLMMVFSKDALTQIAAMMAPEDTVRVEIYGPAWLCSNCGNLEQISN
jgi:DNA-directed RNA polymerase subunit M/transcription elongation factor TFIIS